MTGPLIFIPESRIEAATSFKFGKFSSGHRSLDRKRWISGCEGSSGSGDVGIYLLQVFGDILAPRSAITKRLLRCTKSGGVEPGLTFPPFAPSYLGYIHKYTLSTASPEIGSIADTKPRESSISIILVSNLRGIHDVCSF
jgi:hypothetical protein